MIPRAYLQWQPCKRRVADPLRDDGQGRGDAGHQVPGQAAQVVAGQPADHRQGGQPELPRARPAQPLLRLAPQGGALLLALLVRVAVRGVTGRADVRVDADGGLIGGGGGGGGCGGGAGGICNKERNKLFKKKIKNAR